MSNRLFQLVPESNLDRVRYLRRSRCVTGIAAAVAAVAIACLAGTTWLDMHSRAMLASAQETGAPVIRIEQEIQALRTIDEELAKALELQRSLGVSIPANGVVRAVSEVLPQGAMIRSITLQFQNVQGAARRQRRSSSKDADDAAPRALECVVEGIAADDADVGGLVDGLARLPALSNVNLESSRSYEFRGRNAREFKITFQADLERRWKLPEVATAAVAANDTDANGRGWEDKP